MRGLLTSLTRSVHHWSCGLYQRLLQWTKPTNCSPLTGTLTDLARPKAELVAEKALFRLAVTDLVFRSLCAFFIIELQSRKVIHIAVTRHPTDAWVAQQLREAIPFGQAPRFLIRDNDSKFGPLFARVASTSGIKVLKTPFRAPRANACCERFLGSVRRDCLDQPAHPPRAAALSRTPRLCRLLQSRTSPSRSAAAGPCNE